MMGARLADERKMVFKLHHTLLEVLDAIGDVPGTDLAAEVRETVRQSRHLGLDRISPETVTGYEATPDPANAAGDLFDYRTFATEYAFKLGDVSYRIARDLSTTISGRIDRVPDRGWCVQMHNNPDMCLHDDKFKYKLYQRFDTADDAYTAVLHHHHRLANPPPTPTFNTGDER